MSEASIATIAGLGLTEVGKVYGRSASDFAADAARRATADAGMQLGDIDGLLVTPGTQGRPNLTLQKLLGLRVIRPGVSGGLLSREDETYGSRIEAVLG
ncbi:MULTISPECIES: hypothetical protein [unclassified Gordonia (in: high G+C Gram-positive bacteria)]